MPEPVDEHTRLRMQRQRRRDTSCELAIREELFRRGRRYRVDVRVEPDLRTRADLAWKKRRIAVFVDGCFWHGCPRHGTSPRSNAEWWASKLETNRRRDERTTALLEERGWRVLRFWEHVDPFDAVDEIERALDAVDRANDLSADSCSECERDGVADLTGDVGLAPCPE